MSKSKRIDLICSIGAVLMVLITLVVMCGGGTLITAASIEMPYVSKLFSTDRVHQIDIVADEKDWQNMLDNATAEEYISCTAVIDGEKYANVAIRPKGNSSLSTVASSDSDRYSFKIEFDHYDKNSTYHGLDKLCLNNAIQDNTYMKDYICYQMMNYLGADAPLSSFVWITVNGSDWGLYTAVEGVEDAFAERNYGTSHGQIYKPDSMDMGGGGRGAEKNGGGDFTVPDTNNTPDMGDFLSDSDMFDLDSIKEFLIEKGVDEQVIDEFISNTESIDINEIMSFLSENGVGMSDVMEFMQENGGISQMFGFGGFGHNGNSAESEDSTVTEENEFGRGNAMENIGKGFGGAMGSSDDVLLVYSDDDPDSYPNIFDNAVFNDVTDADQSRLISALKLMNEGDIENSVNIDEVLRYFAVHNFVLNEDSYTGSITHNYYLYEENGLMSMIAWDYNLAFGGMGMGMGGTGGATSYVNSPIDSPVTSGDISGRPMVAWIFDSEEYTEQYHAVMNELITNLFESGEFEAMIDNAVSLISSYVEKDPTAFCTYEEFEKGVETLKEFCLLRAESIRGQLEGDIPSTSEGQNDDSSNFVDASHLTLSDMGSQNTGMDNKLGMGGFGNTERSRDGGKADNFADSTAAPDDNIEIESSEQNDEVQLSAEGADSTERSRKGGQMGGDGAMPEMPDGEQMPDGMGGPMGQMNDGEASPEMPNGEQMPTNGENMMGGEMPNQAGGEEGIGGEAAPEQPENEQPSGDGTEMGGAQDGAENIGGEAAPEQPENEQPSGDGTEMGGTQDGAENIGGEAAPEQREDFKNGFNGGANMPTEATGTGNTETWLLLGGSIIILLAGLLFAKFYK